MRVQTCFWAKVPPASRTALLRPRTTFRSTTPPFLDSAKQCDVSTTQTVPLTATPRNRILARDDVSIFIFGSSAVSRIDTDSTEARSESVLVKVVTTGRKLPTTQSRSMLRMTWSKAMEPHMTSEEISRHVGTISETEPNTSEDAAVLSLLTSNHALKGVLASDGMDVHWMVIILRNKKLHSLCF